jgi:microsomal dipeptidase-like Zn-dependent dipeptidase
MTHRGLSGQLRAILCRFTWKGECPVCCRPRRPHSTGRWKGIVRTIISRFRLFYLRMNSVGLGSDFDGIGEVPVGLEDVSKYPALVRASLSSSVSFN